MHATGGKLSTHLNPANDVVFVRFQIFFERVIYPIADISAEPPLVVNSVSSGTRLAVRARTRRAAFYGVCEVSNISTKSQGFEEFTIFVLRLSATSGKLYSHLSQFQEALVNRKVKLSQKTVGR